MTAGDDQRQGVSEAVHAALDELDALRIAPLRLGTAELLTAAHLHVANAVCSDELGTTLSRARSAAAALLLFLERHDG